MSESQNQSSLSDQLISEVDLLAILNINKVTLDGLRREKGFPFCRLSFKDRVYLVADVIQWVKQQRKTID